MHKVVFARGYKQGTQIKYQIHTPCIKDPNPEQMNDGKTHFG